MTRGQGDNGEPRFTLEMTLDDLPMMVDLMMYGGTRAMLYGKDGKAAAVRFERLREQVGAMSPIPQRYSKTGYAWADACAAARSASEVWVALDVRESHSRGVEGVAIDIHADGRSFRVVDDMKTLGEADALALRVEDLMEPLVGLDGRMLFRLEGQVEVDDGGRYPYEETRKRECVRAALEQAFGDDAETVRVSRLRSASGSRVAAVFHVPAGLADEFAEFLSGRRVAEGVLGPR